MLNVTTKSPDDDRDWVLETIINYKQKLPTKIDYRSKLKNIRNQGSLGTCAAHTAACIREYQESEDINFTGYFSPMFIYNNRTNQDTSGMYGREVMSILRHKGVCPEQYLQYGTIIKPDKMSETTKNVAANFIIKGYARITTIRGLKTALVLYGPCYISFPTYSNNTNMWMPLHKGQKPTGGHAMTIVGYNKKGFIIRNSWGDKWGDKGYCYYPYDDFGAHWEIWSTVDEKSENIVLPPGLKCCPYSFF